MRGRPAQLRLLRLVNPAVRLVLRSRWHRALSGSLMLLTYHGSRSGRSFTIPVLYAISDAGVVTLAAAPEQKRWWRAFRSAAPATLRISGQELAATGRLLEGDEARRALAEYVARFPRVAGTLKATVPALVLFEPEARA